MEGPSAANAWKPSLPRAVGYPPYPSEAGASDPLKLPPPPMQAQDHRARFGLAASTVATNASADVHSASTTSGAYLLSSAMHPAAGSSAKVPWAAGIATRTHDTLAEMTQQTRPVDAPGPGASAEERAQFIHHQLESLAGREVLQGLLFLDGSSNRLQGGALLWYSMLQPQRSAATCLGLLARSAAACRFMFCTYRCVQFCLTLVETYEATSHTCLAELLHLPVQARQWCSLHITR
jgi:hypothetical protein